MDLASLIQNTISTTAGMGDAVTQITAFSKAGQDAASTQADNANIAADAQSEKTRLELEEKARQEQNMNELQLRLGGNPLMAGSFIQAAAEKVKKGYADAADAESRIHEKNAVGFFENPAQWLINKATVGKDVEDYRNAAVRVNSGEQEALDLSKLLDEGQKAVLASSNVYSKAYIGASQTVAAAAARQAATQAQMEGARMGIAGITAATSISAEALKLGFAANSAQAQAKSMDIELQRLQLARDTFDLNAEVKKDKQKSEQVMQDYVATGYFARTGKVLPDSERALVATKLQMKDPRVMDWFDVGMQSSMVGVPVVDISPYRATEAIATNKITKWDSPAMQQVGDELVTLRKQWESPAVQNSAQYDKNDKTARERAFNSWVQGKISEPGRAAIFQPMSLKQTVALNKNLDSMPVWQNILKPAADAGANVDDPNTAFGIITGAMASGKLSYADALDYSPLIAGAQNAKNMGNNLVAFGLKPVKSVSAKIKLTQDFGSDQVNVVDQMEWARALNRAMGIRATTVDQSTLGKVASPFGEAYMSTVGRVNAGGKPTYTPENQAAIESTKRRNQEGN